MRPRKAALPAAAALACLAVAACAPLFSPPPGCVYRLRSEVSPRPLKIHIVEIDLAAAGLSFEVRLGADPDGEGPASSQLVNPLAFAERRGAAVLLNANAFASLAGEADAADPFWYDGRPVMIAGWAVEEGRERSPFDPSFASVWVRADGSLALGAVKPAGAVRAAASGFSLVLEAGLPLSDGNPALHPRSGIGVDASGRRVWLVAVDGRRAGYSEGMSTEEFGQLFLELGARDALNLDGGGSTALVLALADGSRRVVNLPSDAPAFSGYLRPVPVMISFE